MVVQTPHQWEQGVVRDHRWIAKIVDRISFNVEDPRHHSKFRYCVIYVCLWRKIDNSESHSIWKCRCGFEISHSID